MKSELENLIGRYRGLGIDRQLDYDRFCLYSIITHSTAIRCEILSGPRVTGDGYYESNIRGVENLIFELSEQ